MITEKSALATALKDKGYSVTKVRQTVFNALDGTEPLSMHDLLAKLSKVDRASVYRTISLFEELGIVRRLQIGWKYKLELTDKFHYHHHHISCTECGAIYPLREDARLEATLENLAHEYGFTAQDHQLEIQGLCNKCRNQ